MSFIILGEKTLQLLVCEKLFHIVCTEIFIPNMRLPVENEIVNKKDINEQ